MDDGQWSSDLFILLTGLTDYFYDVRNHEHLWKQKEIKERDLIDRHDIAMAKTFCTLLLCSVLPQINQKCMKRNKENRLKSDKTNGPDQAVISQFVTLSHQTPFRLLSFVFFGLFRHCMVSCLIFVGFPWFRFLTCCPAALFCLFSFFGPDYTDKGRVPNIGIRVARYRGEKAKRQPATQQADKRQGSERKLQLQRVTTYGLTTTT